VSNGFDFVFGEMAKASDVGRDSVLKTEGKKETTANEIWRLVEPVIEAEGMELIEVEYRRESQGWVLRLFIDGEDGITVADCAEISHVVGDLLDVSNPINHPYRLEISSPGVDRPLRKPGSFHKFIGSIVEAKTSVPVIPSENRRRFKGELVQVTSHCITLDCGGSVYEIPFGSLERAHLCYFDSQEKQK
jgi:ribosome maturation factor RimP